MKSTPQSLFYFWNKRKLEIYVIINQKYWFSNKWGLIQEKLKRYTEGEFIKNNLK